MAEPQWTVVWVPHGAGTSRTLGISLRSLKFVAGIGGAAAALAVLFVYWAVTKSVDVSRLERLEQTNQILAQEVVQTRTLLRAVADTVAAIGQQDERVRLIAGLPPTDPDVRRAGIGGPAAAMSERERILVEDPTGRAALVMQSDVEGLIRRANILARSFREAAESLEIHKDRLARTPSIMPTRGWLSSNFALARMHPIFHKERPHEGIDISAPTGTPIIAPAGGLVIDVQLNEPGYGNLVEVDHGYGIVTRYAHCSKILVHVGQRVRRGDEIALVGSTGLASGPHLHYEVEVNGRPRNPKSFIFPDKIVE